VRPFLGPSKDFEVGSPVLEWDLKRAIVGGNVDAVREILERGLRLSANAIEYMLHRIHGPGLEQSNDAGWIAALDKHTYCNDELRSILESALNSSLFALASHVLTSPLAGNLIVSPGLVSSCLKLLVLEHPAWRVVPIPVKLGIFGTLLDKVKEHAVKRNLALSSDGIKRDGDFWKTIKARVERLGDAVAWKEVWNARGMDEVIEGLEAERVKKKENEEGEEGGLV